MEKFLGVKLIQAEPATRYSGEGYADFVYSDERPITHEDYDKYIGLATKIEAGYKVVYPDGYVSWSPKEAFEEAYRRIDNLTFGHAVEAAKKGMKLTRSGWNGKGMFFVYQKGYPQGIPCNKQTAKAWGMNEGDLFICRPYLQLKCADGTHAMWTPSTSDVLAEDWQIVE